MIKKYTYLLFLLVGTLLSCSEPQENEEKKKGSRTDSLKKELQEAETVENTYYDDLASVMAGTPPATDTFSTLVQSKAWQSYSQNIQKTWQNKSSKFDILKAWALQELAEPNKIDGGCFYPFAGADILHTALFFPDFKSYYLIGLEPVGSLPPLLQMSEEELNEYFASLEKSMYHILNLSFFRTLSMKVDLTGKRAEELNGTIHLLLVFLKQLDYKIIDIQPMAFDVSGKLVPVDTLSKQAVRIVFSPHENPESAKELYYFSADLSDAHFDEQNHLYQWLQNQPISTTFIKSASYLMHKNYFSHIRSFILNKSRFVLQDDSGIPLRFFNDGNWHIQLYGNYTRPIALFKDWYQKDLYDLYRHENIKPLPFGIGYKYRKGESTLMLMKKKK
ncbi:MAG: hypothetical protein KatS3mg033_0383 [Thermonema sp.]|uniref:hypothetical protein n=1 Tax=Thermonema sp. TaxID=2231181 RepID=UPI0021DE862B|nr:hypothetical protein [Thermonema sp.]GIV38583.1 MAG: hypothetical protein KatS3mg033_0383 [Thermonema sp.]